MLPIYTRKKNSLFIKDKLEEIYSLFPILKEKRLANGSSLSGGQQQRVAIIRSLALHPRMLLLDEITSALDPVLVNEVLSLVRDLKSDGMTMLLATHEMGFARQVANRVVFMDGGEIVEENAPEEFFSNPRNERTQLFLSQILH